MTRKLSLIVLLLLLHALLPGCQPGTVRGLSGEQHYVSSSRPSIDIASVALPLLGSEHRVLKLTNCGVIGGLSIETWITVYGSEDGPFLVVAHADLPPGWRWDANMRHSFALDEATLEQAGIVFYAQSYMDRQGKNPFVREENAEKDPASCPRWMVRAYSSRFNDNRSKIIVEYREKAPGDVTTLSRLPLGHDRLLRSFAERADKAWKGNAYTPVPATGTQAIPVLRTRFLDTNFFGTATALDLWRYR
ncbi:MAG: DUF4851 domain-containing protein [Desulfovibrio sp.]|nr:DUF4851 domain-containing protein [Desulfovibrio sp.]